MFTSKLLKNTSLALLLAGAVAPAVSLAAEPGAELKTYQREDGQTFFALSLAPPDSAATSDPCDVVILFDTSASQSGAYRETALAAVDACIAKLRPEDRVQIIAADLEARPITEKFLAANSKELRTAIESLRADRRTWSKPCVRPPRGLRRNEPVPAPYCTSATVLARRTCSAPKRSGISSKH
jgi:hypothetical protein